MSSLSVPSTSRLTSIKPSAVRPQIGPAEYKILKSQLSDLSAEESDFIRVGNYEGNLGYDTEQFVVLTLQGTFDEMRGVSITPQELRTSVVDSLKAAVSPFGIEESQYPESCKFGLHLVSTLLAEIPNMEAFVTELNKEPSLPPTRQAVVLPIAKKLETRRSLPDPEPVAVPVAIPVPSPVITPVASLPAVDSSTSSSLDISTTTLAPASHPAVLIGGKQDDTHRQSHPLNPSLLGNASVSASSLTDTKRDALMTLFRELAKVPPGSSLEGSNNSTEDSKLIGQLIGNLRGIKEEAKRNPNGNSTASLAVDTILSEISRPAVQQTLLKDNLLKDMLLVLEQASA